MYMCRAISCSKHVHVEDCNKCIKICASSWSLAKVKTHDGFKIFKHKK